VFDANNSQGYGGLSYYTKGELVGLCLDLKIRQVTGGQRSLDDVMRALYAQVRHGDGPGFGEDDIKNTVNRVSRHDLSDYYDLVARSTEELPFTECLGYVGLKLVRSEAPVAVAASGMTVRPDREFQSIIVSEVTPDGAAARAGLKTGDHIVAVNGQAEMRSIGQILRNGPAGKKSTITVLRDGAKTDVEFTMGTRNLYPWLLTVNPSATKEQAQARQQWLTGKLEERSFTASR
jgi:predicted metalloprotease with PDZ domain